MLLCAACGNDETTEPSDNGMIDGDEPDFELSVNDEIFQFKEDPAVYRAVNELSVDENSVVLGFNFESQADEEFGKISFLMAIQNWKWQVPSLDEVLEKKYDTYTITIGSNTECQMVSGESLCDRMEIFFMKFGTPDPSTGALPNAQYLLGTDSGESAGTFTVTNFNKENSTCSGSFDNIVLRRGLFDEDFESFFPEDITLSGSFENIPF